MMFIMASELIASMAPLVMAKIFGRVIPNDLCWKGHPATVKGKSDKV